MQIGSPCEQTEMPAEVHEEWRLIEEFLLFEGDRALLKLLRCASAGRRQPAVSVQSCTGIWQPFLLVDRCQTR